MTGNSIAYRKAPSSPALGTIIVVSGLALLLGGCAAVMGSTNGRLPDPPNAQAISGTEVEGRIGRFCGLFGVFPGAPNERDLQIAIERALARSTGATELVDGYFRSKQTIIMGLVAMCNTRVRGLPARPVSSAREPDPAPTAAPGRVEPSAPLAHPDPDSTAQPEQPASGLGGPEPAPANENVEPAPNFEPDESGVPTIQSLASGCDAGEPDSCFELGRWFLRGMGGVERNPDLACRAFGDACNEGHLGACDAVAQICELEP